MVFKPPTTSSRVEIIELVAFTAHAGLITITPHCGRKQSLA
jgi:hypothetical protein